MNWDIPTKSVLGQLTLLALPGVGKTTSPRLAENFATLGEIVDARDTQISAVATGKARKSLQDRELWDAAYDKAQRILDLAVDNRSRVTCLFDPDYPKLLRRIPDAPPILYIKGILRSSIQNVACVGTRHPSWFGTEVTRRLVKVLVAHGFGIVSGLAIGIDTQAHNTAVENDSYTVAVLANGLDSIYPRENQRLADIIIDKGGALISEQPFGAKAFAQNLIERDRLQSGMSLATFVFQTDVVGGTLHTVRFTLMQERMLFAPVPPPPYDEKKCKGIRAIVEQSGSQLADLLNATGPYRDLLTTRYKDLALAFGIRGVFDYETVIARLAGSVKDVESSHNRFGSDTS
jgi:DNA processing protein